MDRGGKYRAKLSAALAIVWLVWGSAFLFSKIGVTHLPPSLFSGVRFVLAGLLITLTARFWRRNAWPDCAREWRHVLVMGFISVLLSNGTSLWSLKYITSTESALLTTTSAFWIAGLGAFGPRGHALTRVAVLGLILGALGTLLTILPRLSLAPASLLPYLGVLFASFAWALATVYYRHIHTRLGTMMFIGLQMFCGGLMQIAVGCALGQLADWSMSLPGLVALGYVTLFSSALGYTAYAWLSRNSTPLLIGTYSYVNPAIAAFLGWAVLGDQLRPIQFVGMVVIIASVAIVTLTETARADGRALEEPSSP